MLIFHFHPLEGNSRSGTSCSFATTTAPGSSRCSTQRSDACACFSVCCTSGMRSEDWARWVLKPQNEERTHRFTKFPLLLAAWTSGWLQSMTHLVSFLAPSKALPSTGKPGLLKRTFLSGPCSQGSASLAHSHRLELGPVSALERRHRGSPSAGSVSRQQGSADPSWGQPHGLWPEQSHRAPGLLRLWTGSAALRSLPWFLLILNKGPAFSFCPGSHRWPSQSCQQFWAQAPPSLGWRAPRASRCGNSFQFPGCRPRWRGRFGCQHLGPWLPRHHGGRGVAPGSPGPRMGVAREPFLESQLNPDPPD